MYKCKVEDIEVMKSILIIVCNLKKVINIALKKEMSQLFSDKFFIGAKSSYCIT